MKESYKQLKDKEVQEQVPNNSSIFVITIMKALDKICLWGDFSKGTLSFFLVQDPKFERFYLLPIIHKWLLDVSWKQTISDCVYYTGNISSFSDYHLQTLTQKVKLYIKDTNGFLNKIKT